MGKRKPAPKMKTYMRRVSGECVNSDFQDDSMRGSFAYFIGRFSAESPTDRKHWVSDCPIRTKYDDYEFGVFCVIDEEGKPKDFNVPYTAGNVEDLAKILIEKGYFFGKNDFIMSYGARTGNFTFSDKEGNNVSKRFILSELEHEDVLRFQNYMVDGKVVRDFSDF